MAAAFGQKEGSNDTAVDNLANAQQYKTEAMRILGSINRDREGTGYLVGEYNSGSSYLPMLQKLFTFARPT